MKIRTKFSIGALLVVLITAIIIYITSTYVAKNIIEKQTGNHLLATAQSRAHNIETFLNDHKQLTLQMSESVVIEKLLTSKKTESDYKTKFDDAIIRLKNSAGINKQIYDIFIIDMNGIVVASNIEERHGLYRGDDPYFIHGKKGVYIKDLYYSRFFKGEKSLAVAAPIVEDVSNDNIGVVVIRFRLDNLYDIVTDTTGLGKTGKIYLLNKNGYMITPSRFIDDTFLKTKVSNAQVKSCFSEHINIKKGLPVNMKEKVASYTDYRGKQVLGTHYYIPEMQWCLLAEIDKKEAYEPVKILIRLMLVIFIIFLAFAIIGYLLISSNITKPIEELHKGAEEIISGNLDYKVGVKKRDEIGQLSRTFDKMTSNLKKSREKFDEYSKSLEEQVKERTAELRKQFEKSEQQRIGTLNILKDLDETNIDLKNEITERKQAERIQRTLYNIANAVNTTSNLDELYKLIHIQLGTIVDTTNFYVALYDEKNNIITAPYYVDQLKKIIPPPQQLRNGLTAYVIHTAKPLYLTVEKREKLMKEGKIAKTDWKSKIWIGVPLKTKNKVIGALAVQSYTDASLYTKKDMEILEFVSDAISLAINRKTAEKELKKHLRELEIYYKATMGREERIIELKHKINELLEELGKEKKYLV